MTMYELHLNILSLERWTDGLAGKISAYFGLFSIIQLSCFIVSIA